MRTATGENCVKTRSTLRRRRWLSAVQGFLPWDCTRMKGPNAEGVGQFGNLEIFQRTPSEFTVIKQLDPRVETLGCN